MLSKAECPYVRRRPILTLGPTYGNMASQASTRDLNCDKGDHVILGAKDPNCL
jgi:hypothetical protein